jgi:hypothetical protein
MEILTEEQVKKWSNITPGNRERILALIKENKELRRRNMSKPIFGRSKIVKETGKTDTTIYLEDPEKIKEGIAKWEAGGRKGLLGLWRSKKTNRLIVTVDK